MTISLTCAFALISISSAVDTKSPSGQYYYDPNAYFRIGGEEFKPTYIASGYFQQEQVPQQSGGYYSYVGFLPPPQGATAQNGYTVPYVNSQQTPPYASPQQDSPYTGQYKSIPYQGYPGSFYQSQAQGVQYGQYWPMTPNQYSNPASPIYEFPPAFYGEYPSSVSSHASNEGSSAQQNPPPMNPEPHPTPEPWAAPLPLTTSIWNVVTSTLAETKRLTVTKTSPAPVVTVHPPDSPQN